MPQVAGLTLAEAHQALEEVGLRHDEADLSEPDRSVWVEENWTVVASNPAAGEAAEPRTKVLLGYLRNEEVAWLVENPTMPKVKAGSDTSDLTDEGHVLSGMSELLDYQWAKGNRPSDAYEDESYGIDLVVGSNPAAGGAILPGQLIVITEREARQKKHQDDSTDTTNSPKPKKYTGPRCYAPGGKTWRPC